MLEKLQYWWSKTNRWYLGIFIFLLVELRLLPGGQLGFYCNDPALSHPFTGDTISWKWLLGVTLLLPPVIMLIVERNYNANEKTKEYLKKQTLCWYKQYLFGVLVNLIVIESLKLIVGSPRPHFFDTCRPEEALKCEGSEFISSYTCTKAHWLSQSNRSFPSGHTSLGLHTGFFIAYYLYRRTQSPRSRAIFATQAICIVGAVYCGISRILDHRHHWWDVLAGAGIAVPILFYTVMTLCRNFECPREGIEECTDNIHEKNYSNGHNSQVELSSQC